MSLIRTAAARHARWLRPHVAGPLPTEMATHLGAGLGLRAFGSLFSSGRAPGGDAAASAAGELLEDGDADGPGPGFADCGPDTVLTGSGPEPAEGNGLWAADPATSHAHTPRGGGLDDVDPSIFSSIPPEAASPAATWTGGLADSLLRPVAESIDLLHHATGLPWWATLVGVAATVRLALFPLTLRAQRAQRAYPLLAVARAQLQAEAKAGAAFDADARRKAGRGGRTRAPAGAEPAAAATAAAVDPRAVASRFAELRRRTNLPHPAWIVASPILQVPVFVAAMASTRRMALEGWPGYAEGGLAWFSDLSAVGLDLSTYAAPSGALGAILPASVVLLSLANIDRAFGTLVEKGGQAGAPADLPASVQRSEAVRRHLARYVRLVLELAMAPTFLIALQLPAGSLIYWAASSAAALAQGTALRALAARDAARLAAARGAERSTDGAGPVSRVGGGAARPGVPAGGEGSGGAARLAAPPAANVEARDAYAGDPRAEARKLMAELAASPGDAGVARRLARLASRQRDWSRAQRWFRKAAEWGADGDAAMAARAWMGAGLAAANATGEAASRGESSASAAPGRAGDFPATVHEALACLERALELGLDAERAVQARVARAQLLRGAGDPAAAEIELRLAAELDPSVEARFLEPLRRELRERRDD